MARPAALFPRPFGPFPLPFQEPFLRLPPPFLLFKAIFLPLLEALAPYAAAWDERLARLRDYLEEEP